jgi:hypothetical protein
MFCPNCGLDNTTGFNYCNRCGLNLNPDKPKTVSTAVVVFFLMAIAFITIIGFSMPLIAMSELHNKGFNPKGLIAFSIFMLFAVVSVDYLLIGLLTRLLGVSTFDRVSGMLRSQRPECQVPVKNLVRLPEHQMPFRSVTESTTRNFDPVAVRVRNTNE